MSRLFLFLLALLAGCAQSEDLEIPGHIPKLDNLTVVTADEPLARTFHLSREMEFGNSTDLLIGDLGSFTVDDSNRVYLGGIQQQAIYIFDQYGNYKGSMGRHGRGPGEFQFVGYQKIVNDFLFVYDPPQFRLNVFSTNDFGVYETIPFRTSNKRDYEELSEYDLGIMHPISKNRFLGVFTTLFVVSDPSHPNYNLNSRYRLFYILDDTGRIISDKMFKHPALRALSAVVNGEYRFTQFEFLGSTLLDIDNQHHIYVAQSEEFLIKVYNSGGNYLRAYYYPFQKKVFTREEAIRQQKRKYEEGVVEWRVSVIEQAPEEQMPQAWPALNDLKVDDEGRIWVSTIVEDFDIYEWWVLEETGELITKFEWPRNEPIEVVKNGYMYTRETDGETGLQQVVRYRIEIGD